MTAILPILAFLPGLLVCYIIYRLDKYEREPFLAMAFAYLMGAIATLPSVVLQRWGFSLIWPPMPDTLLTFLQAFGTIALNEECFKIAALLIAAYPWRFFNEPMDGIVYAVMVAMGFSSIENLAYAHEFGIETALVRIVTAMPAHLVFAIITGFYVGKAKFLESGTARFVKISKGLFWAVFFHGLYDFLILQNWTEWLYLLAVVGLYTSLYFAMRMIKIRQEESPFREVGATATADAGVLPK